MSFFFSQHSPLFSFMYQGIIIYEWLYLMSDYRILIRIRKVLMQRYYGEILVHKTSWVTVRYSCFSCPLQMKGIGIYCGNELCCVCPHDFPCHTSATSKFLLSQNGNSCPLKDTMSKESKN